MILQAPEIQNMYSLNMPVSALRTKMRQEFERHRYVSQLPVVDMLLFQSHAEYQVSSALSWVTWQDPAVSFIFCIVHNTSVDCGRTPQRQAHKHFMGADIRVQETLNYWKQLPHILKYFRAEEDPAARRPQNFINGFLEVMHSRDSRFPSPY